MIDFIKAEIYGPSVLDLVNHPSLDFEGKFDIKTGETHTEEQTAKYENLKFIIKSNNYIIIQGSLHKFFTNGINYNDFFYSDLHKTLAKLTDDFGINLSKSPIHNLEYGLNINLPQNPQNIIKTLINHKGETFEKMFGQAKKTGRQCVKQQYTIKVYDKGHQCNVIGNLLRFEIKVTKMKYLEKYGIKFLGDLTDKDKLKLLFLDLENAFNEILMYDTNLNLNKCSISEKKLLTHGRYSEYWIDLKKENSKMHDYYRRKFRKLTEKYGQNDQRKVLALIQAKANSLLNVKIENLANLTRDKKDEEMAVKYGSYQINRP